MYLFTNDVIKPYIRECDYKKLCEIGASHGADVDMLLELEAVEFSIIDPCLDENLCVKYEHNTRIKMYKGLSLDVLPKLSEKFNCILIDGDHNWFTVFNELNIIEKNGLLKEGGVIFLDDVSWPYGRRDLYYQPETIPAEFRHPYAMKGIIEAQVELSETGGANADLYNALHEGGMKNGVLTAVEDFLKTHKGRYAFFYFKEDYGLGILYKKDGFKTSWTFIKWLLIRQMGLLTLRKKYCKLLKKINKRFNTHF